MIFRWLFFNCLNRREKHHFSIKRIQNDKCRFAYLKTSSSIISKRFNYFNMYCWAFTIALHISSQKMLPVTDFQFSMPVVLQRHLDTFKYRLFQTLTGKKERTWTTSNDFPPLSYKAEVNVMQNYLLLPQLHKREIIQLCFPNQL